MHQESKIRPQTLAALLVTLLLASAIGILVVLARSSQSSSGMREEAEETLLVLEMERNLEIITAHTSRNSGLEPPPADTASHADRAMAPAGEMNDPDTHGPDMANDADTTSDADDVAAVSGEEGHLSFADHPELVDAFVTFSASASTLYGLLPPENRSSVARLTEQSRLYEASVVELHGLEDSGGDAMSFYHDSTQGIEADIRSGIHDLQEFEAHEIHNAIIASRAADTWLRWLVPTLLVLALAITGSIIWLTAEVQRKEIASLSRAGKEKDRFMATVSHELRTPLTSVVGFIDLLSGDSSLDDAQRKELLDLADSEALDLSHIVDNLLVYGRGTDGQMATQVPTSLRAQTSQVLEAMSVPDDVSIDVQGHATGLADPSRVRQVVRNLVNNALRYGGPHIRIVLDREDEMARARVIDDGPGVTAGREEAIFEAYQRAHDTPTQPGSVGLGLWVSRRLATDMCGDLSYSRANGETVFAFSIPAGLSSLSDNPTPARTTAAV